MLAREVMTTNVVTVLEDTPIHDIVRTLLKWRISAVPVLDDKELLVGIVSEGDLIRRAGSQELGEGSWWLAGLLESEGSPHDFTKAAGKFAKDVMTTSVISASPDDRLSRVAEILEQHGIKRVPIVDDGKLVGLVSRANLLHGIAAAPEPAAEPVPPPQASSDDESIRAMIQNRLRNDLRIGRAINVIVRDGVADVWGGVETESERQDVRVVVENVPGVTAVKDHIYVMSPALRHLLGADNEES
jgi:CBS domain-containing protein